MMRYFPIFSLLFLVVAAFSAIGANAANPQIAIITAKGTVNPALADYIDRGITEAEENNAVACIIELDTPGGLLSSTEEITNRILNATVPIVVYVNRWAGSAGTFITLAADVAAMASGSRIGAAHPVAGGGEEISEVMKKKITEDTAANARRLAEMHGRNVKAAEATVCEALSFTDQEALGLVPLTEAYQRALGCEKLQPPLVDVGADSLDQLIEKLNKGITLANGNEFHLPTSGATKNFINMTGVESFLHTISNPNIAYILLSIAMLGILIELSHPGLILPGVVGGVCLFLSLYSLGVLGANWAGLLLILLAFGLFVAEIFTPTFGLLTAGGITALTLGSLILFSGTSMSIDWRLIGVVVSLVTAIFVFIVFAVVRAHRRQVTTGKEGMIGQVAVALTALDPKGTVFIKGERWSAIAEGGKIEPGEEVIVIGVEGLKLKVKKSK